MSPSTPEDHRALFYAALDIACAVMNIQYGGELEDYVQNFEVIALLTRPTIAYTTVAYEVANAIRVNSVQPTAVPGYKDPFARAPNVHVSGLAVLGANNAPAIRIVDSRRFELVLDAAQQHIMPGFPIQGYQDHIWVRAVWRPIVRGIQNNGQLIDLSNGLNITVEGAVWPPGQIRVIGRVQAVGAANNGAVVGIASFEVLEYARARAGVDATLTARADINSMWTYGDERWQDVRMNLLQALDIGTTYPPYQPAWDAKYATAYAVIGRLFRVYAAHGLIAGPGQGGLNAARIRMRDAMGAV